MLPSTLPELRDRSSIVRVLLCTLSHQCVPASAACVQRHESSLSHSFAPTRIQCMHSRPVWSSRERRSIRARTAPYRLWPGARPSPRPSLCRGACSGCHRRLPRPCSHRLLRLLRPPRRLLPHRRRLLPHRRRLLLPRRRRLSRAPPVRWQRQCANTTARVYDAKPPASALDVDTGANTSAGDVGSRAAFPPVVLHRGVQVKVKAAVGVVPQRCRTPHAGISACLRSAGQQQPAANTKSTGVSTG